MSEVTRRDHAAARTSALREAFGTDVSFYAKFVEIWRRPRKIGSGPFAEGVPETPVDLNDIAWETGTSQGGVAIKMKYMVKQGLARRTSPRTEQAAFEPTEKGLAFFPDADARPDPGELVTEKGARVTAESSDEARTWGEVKEGEEFPEFVPVEEAARQLRGRRHSGDELPTGGEFKGYLSAGDDAAE